MSKNDQAYHSATPMGQRSLRTRARWKKIRAATLVFILFRRRANHGPGRNHKATKRMASTMFFSRESSQPTAAIATALLVVKPTAQSSQSRQLDPSATQKLAMLERVIRKPIHNRSDVDIKLLAEFIRHTKFFHGLSSASIDALAMKTRFRICHEGELLHRQGSFIDDACGRYLVVTGSLLVYKNAQYSQHANEGEDYVAWFMATNAGATRDSIKYGDCVDTCSTGDTCGDDAIAGNLFREHSVIAQEKAVIAFVIQADYKRVIRFNVENEPHVLDAVRVILTPAKPTKQELRQAKPPPDHHSAHDHTPQPQPTTRIADYSPQQIRMLLRFLGRFACFRILPTLFCMEIISKLQLVTVRSDDVVCAPSSESKPSMIMVLDGKLCVHVHETHEAHILKALDESRREAKYTYSNHRRKITSTRECQPGCEAGSTVAMAIGDTTLHLCALGAGDSFGELALSDANAYLQGASVYHPVLANGQAASATVVRLLRHDYEAVVQRYVDTVDFNIGSVCAMLTKSLPQDRTDEQVFYIKTFMTQRSSAKLFFGQLPSRKLDSLLLQAHLESHEVDDESEDFIQREDTPLESMRIVLNGYVGVFKGAPSASAGQASTGKATNVDASEEKLPLPKKAVLRRYQSRLVRANTHMLDTGSAKPSGRRASVSRSAAVPLPQISNTDAGALEPVSILACGAVFGHLQILTGQPNSPYSYAAFAASASDQGWAAVAIGGAHGVKTCVLLLSIPARFVQLYLSAIDDQIIYNPVRVYKRLQHGTGSSLQRSGGSASSLIRALRVPRLLAHGAAFKGIPMSIAAAMIEEMSIVKVEPRRVIYELGDPVNGMLFVVLSGTVRVFNYVNPMKNRRGSSVHQGADEKRPKFPRRVSQESSLDAKTDQAMNAAENPEYFFEKPAGDAVFMSDYSQTMELFVGDSFGRHGAIAARHGQLDRRGSSSTPSTPRRNSHANSVSLTYPESVVTMSDCLVGVLTRHSDAACELSKSDRALLIRITKERDDTPMDQDTAEASSSSSSYTPTFDSLASSFRVLEAMGLAHRLSTQHRVQVANCLKYRRLAPGETVYKQGEAGQAIYFVIFGSVTLFMKSRSDASKDSKTRASLSDIGLALMDVAEGEVFGEEVFHDVHGPTRHCTATAMDDGHGAELLYLSRDEYDRIVDEHATLLTQPARPKLVAGKHDGLLRLLGLGHRTMSPKERWKMAIYQVIHRRTQRSQWPTVLTKARNRRIDLLVDLIKDLPIFEDTSLATLKKFCGNGVLQTFNQDTLLFSKGDAFVNICFLVVHGSVTLYQVYYGNSGSSSSAVAGGSGLTMAPGVQAENMSMRVHIDTIKAGEICGEYEGFEEHPRRHINAVVAEPGTKLVIVQHDDFFALWPQREQLERKLAMLKTQLRKPCRLDSDQLCSLYYAMKERTFRRNEVLSGNKEQAGHLHIVQDGMCVVHDLVVLKQKQPQAGSSTGAKKTGSPRKQLSLDTRVSTLGCGAILFAEPQDKPVDTRPRIEPPRAAGVVEAAPFSDPKPTQYVVADSPTVTTLCVQLFPRRFAAGSRAQEVFVEFLLGKSGLQVIRDTVDLQAKWRAENVVNAGRLVVNSLATNPSERFATTRTDTECTTSRSKISMKPAAPQDIARVLLRRDCQADDVPTVAAATAQPPVDRSHLKLALSPRARLHNTDFWSFASKETSMSMLESFSPLASPQRPSLKNQECSIVAAPLSPPILPSLCSPTGFPTQSCFSPRQPERQPPLQVPVWKSADQQLRREERVLVSVVKPAPRQDAHQAAQQLQMRRRRGHPPPKHVENNGKFVDEHAFSAVTGLHDDHERKKSGLCRRLLHVKGTSGSSPL